MTDTPTQAPTDSAVEPAGLSQEEREACKEAANIVSWLARWQVTGEPIGYQVVDARTHEEIAAILRRLASPSQPSRGKYELAKARADIVQTPEVAERMRGKEK